MKRHTVPSTTFSSLDYDPGREVLEAEFLHGGVYRYYQVPQGLWLDFLSAESKGGFFSQHIRGKYRYRKMR